MPLLIGLIAAALGWALWTGRIKLAQLPPIVLAFAGAFLALRGQWLIGLAAAGVGVSWYRGLTWRMFGLKTKQSPEYHLANARALLGVSVHDDAERIRARHRKLISENHPDRGGSEQRATELNQSRDLLLDDLERKSR
jgi:DnaJ homolog subfamily C member 19